MSVDVFKPKITIFSRSIPNVLGMLVLQVSGLNVFLKQTA